MKGIKLTPLENRVVVLPDDINEKLGSGLLVKAETTKQTDQRSQTKGILVSIGSLAFDDWTLRPLPGDRIEFAMYAGQFYTEGETQYRIMYDGDVIGVLKEKV